MAPTTTQAQNGVLQISTSALNKPASTPKNASSKATAPRLKVIIRRLAPGLSENEFKEALGDEWRVGGGKVDWILFKPGKVSKDLAKPSYPSRAYLRVTEQSLLAVLAEKVKQTTFNDAKNTSKDSSLISPPIVEFAPYPRVPGGRRPRHDARQGLIDQDPEFKDFLESLTNPITKPLLTEGVENIPPKEEIKTTPLIEHIREKKAQKDKPVTKSSGKHGRNESKDSKAEHVTEKKILSKSGKDTTSSSEKGKRSGRTEKASKEAIKVLSKEAATAASQSAAASEKTSASPAPEKKRPNASLAAKVLQRDLGIGPAAGRRRGSKRELTTEATGPTKSADSNPPETPTSAEAEKSPATAQQGDEAVEKTSTSKKERHRHSRAERRAHQAAKAAAAEQKAASSDSKAAATPAAPTILKKPSTSTQVASNPSPAPAASPKNPPTAPKGTSRRTSNTVQAQASPQNTSSTASPQSTKAAPTVASSTQPPRQAFLKHANPSQGITETLIEEALSTFGKVEKVEIDKRKGFAYVDFAEPEGLQKAIAASPVKVAQGAVQVLERRERIGGKLAPAVGTPTSTPAANQGQPQAGAPRGGGQGGFRGGRGRGRGGGAGRNRGGQENTGQQQATQSSQAAVSGTAQSPSAAAAAAAPPPPDGA